MGEVTVLTCPVLLTHLSTFEHDGTTVAGALFSDGRLQYPGRWDVEDHLGDLEPYTLSHEARVVTGLGVKAEAAIRLLSREATRRHVHVDPTLDLLWTVHGSLPSPQGTSLDRLVAALVSIQELTEGLWWDDAAQEAAIVLVAGLHSLGFPPNRAGLEELFDGADPACVGLGLVEL